MGDCRCCRPDLWDSWAERSRRSRFTLAPPAVEFIWELGERRVLAGALSTGERGTNGQTRALFAHSDRRVAVLWLRCTVI